MIFQPPGPVATAQRWRSMRQSMDKTKHARGSLQRVRGYWRRVSAV